MIKSLLERSASIAEICVRHRVRSLDVFGSAARESGFVPGVSDFDFVVEFVPLAPGEHFDEYFGLAEDLERLLGGGVELVELKAVRNEVFRRAVAGERQAVYAAA